MKEIKVTNSRGITLIALVVTIVVLLILAGISITMVLGNNGLITKATDAKAKTGQDAVNTEIAMNNLADEINAILGNGGTGGSDDDTIKIGDYVNYTYDIVEDEYSVLTTQSGYSSDQTVSQSSTVLKWQILNVDKDAGRIDLVSENPTDNGVGFKRELGYNNGVYLLNDICAKLYSNSLLGVTARSINLEDMEKHLTTLGIIARNSYKRYIQYGTTIKYTGSNAYYPNIYANQLGSGINTTDVEQPNIDGTVPDPYQESNSYYTEPTTETLSLASRALVVTQTKYQIEVNSENYGEAAVLFDKDYGYWLASRSFDANSYYGYFGLRKVYSSLISDTIMMYSSDNAQAVGSLRLRPVVSLDINLLDGTKDADGAWNLK